MVCIYCGKATQVVNSRSQKRSNQIWRRRRCQNCQAVFTTLEAPDLSTSLTVRTQQKRLEPFSRDKLLISLANSLGHRKTAINDASELTKAVVIQLVKMSASGEIAKSAIIQTVSETLQRFDPLAGQHYLAYHSFKK